MLVEFLGVKKFMERLPIVTIWEKSHSPVQEIHTVVELLETYSSLRNQLQVTAKLNLALELGDVVNLKRSYPEVIETSATEIKKYEGQQTYYRACKIVGINYNFAKKQMSYTLQDVSDDNNRPPIEFYEFVYTLPIRLGAK